MRKPLLIISRDPHRTLFDGARCLLPLAEIEPHLVTNPWLVEGLDFRDFRHTTVCDFAVDDRVKQTCDWIVEANGVRGIVALHEKMVLMAARLRTVHRLPGLRPDTVLLFRDKIRMKAEVRAHGVDVPDFRALDDEDDLAAVDWSLGRHIIKPRRGVGSTKTYVVGSPATARDVWRRIGAPPGEYEIEEFIAGEMFHCDAIVRDGRVLHVSVGQYHARPGDVAPGATAGSYLVPDGELSRRIAGLNERVVGALLGAGSAVTHLEVFRTPGDRLVFCEIAARPGGGGIDRMVLRRHGVHLREAAIRIEAGLPQVTAERPASIGEQPVWGRIGIYPRGRVPAELTTREYGELGVAEYEYHPEAGGDACLPRHSTDYAHRFILSGSSPADFLAKIDRLRAAAAR